MMIPRIVRGRNKMCSLKAELVNITLVISNNGESKVRNRHKVFLLFITISELASKNFLMNNY